MEEEETKEYAGADPDDAIIEGGSGPRTIEGGVDECSYEPDYKKYYLLLQMLLLQNVREEPDQQNDRTGR
ncbi:unnamed protein product [Gongylonema pulchrum]|uniref:Uncharacterized protein n=1 Tax=Gongylonema pulchrum TaxID=637853 RepID=A0A183D6J3_9BILA|nr:unnamed protein product [Gongylonema pulchrum]